MEKDQYWMNLAQKLTYKHVTKEALCTSPSSPPQSGPNAENPTDAVPSTRLTVPEQPHVTPYVQLELDYTRNPTWSNSPKDLALNNNFTSHLTNLAHDSNIEDLRPVVRGLKWTERFIMKDEKDRYYVWDEWDLNMDRVRVEELEALSSVKEKIDWILDELGDLQVG